MIFGYAWLDAEYGDENDFAWKVNFKGPMMGIQYTL